MSEAKASSSKEELILFSLNEVHRFIDECLEAVGTPPAHADAVAHCLTQADYKGHTCEGLYQLKTYIDEIEQGGCNKEAVPKILKETPVTAWVDGNNGLGVVVANFCMKLAIQKAKTSGVGWVVAKGSNTYGMASNYSLQALEEGLLGMSFTNSAPLVAPTRAVERALGTNPITLAAPGLDDDNFVLDMSTAAVAVGKIEMLGRSKRPEPVPEDWANPSTGTLRPMGGQDPCSNYKGFGLALLVEIFCGILAGSNYGPNIRMYGNSHDKPNLGQCFVAIDPSHFAPGFEQRLSDLLKLMRNLKPADPLKPVLVPGDLERQKMQDVDGQGGIYYVRDVVKRCENLAEKLKVKPLTPIK